MTGLSAAGDGVHILTGPIYVCGAQPGDVLQVCNDCSCQQMPVRLLHYMPAPLVVIRSNVGSGRHSNFGWQNTILGYGSECYCIKCDIWCTISILSILRACMHCTLQQLQESIPTVLPLM